MISQSKAKTPILLLHAGAGDFSDQREGLEEKRQCLREVLDQVWPMLLNGDSALDSACRAVDLLESFPCMNAGRGATRQNDGIARLSASVMDGYHQKFSAVALAEGIYHPARMAKALQEEDNAVLGPPGVEALSRKLGLQEPADTAAVPAPSRPPQGPDHGTVGAVVLDDLGRLAAATSTGGCPSNVPGRLSDVSTPAGNYASIHAAVSATGKGEEIMDDGLALRLETRVRDGRSIIKASDQCLSEARAANRQYGWIGVDGKGNWVLYYSTPHMPCIAFSRNMHEPMLG